MILYMYMKSRNHILEKMWYVSFWVWSCKWYTLWLDKTHTRTHTKFFLIHSSANRHLGWLHNGLSIMSSVSSMLTQIPLGNFEVTPWNPDLAVAGGMTCALHFLRSYKMMGDRSFDCPTEFLWPLDEMGHQNNWPGVDIQQAVKWREPLSLCTERVMGFLDVACVYY